MSNQRCAVTPNPNELIFTWVKSGEIAIPEIQRLFVWAATKVRNLLDSLYQGYQMGFSIARCDHTVKFKKCSELLQGIKLMDLRINTCFKVL